MKTGVLLQTRIGSTRLPGKALLPLAGRTVLEHVLEALKSVEVDVHAIVTDKDSFPLFRDYARNAGFEIFEGPAEDVLARYCMAAEYYGVDTVVRGTGDNPCVSSRLANKNMAIHKKERLDLSRYSGAPLGTGVEIVETWALKESMTRSQDPYEHEHITTYLLRHRDEYKVREVEVPESCAFPGAHVTLDTMEDYRFLSTLYSDLFRGEPLECHEIVQWYKNRSSDIKPGS